MSSDVAIPRAATERIPWIDTGRGIAIVLVTLFHATNWWLSAGYHGTFWLQIDTTLASLRMPLFFTLSGLFAPKWLLASWGDLLRSKVLLFVWVFLIWETLGALFFQLGLTVQDKCCGVKDTVLGLLMAPVLPIYELWFIWSLAIFFIVAKATRRVNPKIQLGVAAALAFVALMGWPGINDGWEGSAKYYLFFIGGIYLRPHILRFGNTRNRWLLGTALAVWAAISVTLAVFGLGHVPGAYFVNSIAGVLGGIALSRFLTPIRFLSRIGQQTLPIYLAHTPIVLTIVFITFETPLHGLLMPISAALPPVLAAVAVVLALRLHRIIMKTRFRFLYEPPKALVTRLCRPVRTAPIAPESATG